MTKISPCLVHFHSQKNVMHKLMVELLEDGTIGTDMAPRDAYRMDPIFLQYSEVAFKSQLKKWKDDNGMGDRPPKRVKEPSICHCMYDATQLKMVVLL